MSGESISLDEAIEQTRTGDVWVFRGRKIPDRAIQLTTNSPVNHVGMSVVIEDLPPLMWHAELGRALRDMWTGGHHRGVQLHDLRDAVCVWASRYGQRAWLRQLEPPVGRPMEDAVLRTVARLDGTPFPSTAQLAWRWLRGRVPPARHLPGVRHLPELRRTPDLFRAVITGTTRAGGPGGPGRPAGPAAAATPAVTDPVGAGAVPTAGTGSDLESAYCAEVVAVTYEAMGLLPAGHRPNWYDPGRFWSGDDLALTGGARLGSEIAVRIPPR